jgi:sodium/pantothenate symporter
MATQTLVMGTTGLLVLLGAGILWLVVRGARQTHSIQDYALGSMSFSPVFVALSLAASITSAATFIINPGFIALYGVSGILALGIVLPIGLYLSLTFLTKNYRKYGQSQKAMTMAQWIGQRYGSKGFAFFFALLSLLLITFVVLICVGMTKVLSTALNLDELPVLLGLITFVFGYMMFGGANSMVYTNTIQALMMIVVAAILLGSGYEHFSQGIHGFLDELAAIDPNLVTATNPESPLFRDFFEIIFCNFIVGIAIVCQPHIITKSLLIKEDRDVNRFLLVAILVETLFFLVVVVGLYARLSFPDLTVDGEPLAMDGIVSAYVVSQFPVYLSIILILGLLAAGLSTLEGLIQSIPTSITTDIVEPLLGDRLGEGSTKQRRMVMLNKGAIVLLAVVSALLSYEQLVHPSLSVGIFAQNGVYAYFSAAFIPVLLGVFFKQVPLIAPVAASATAVVVHFGIFYGRIGPYMQESVRNPAVASALAIVGSTLVGLSLYAARSRRSSVPKTYQR